METVNVCQECVTASPASMAWTARKVGDLPIYVLTSVIRVHRNWQGKAYNPRIHAGVKEETRLCTEEIVCSVVLEEVGITKSRVWMVKRRKHKIQKEMRHKVDQNIDDHKKKKE